MKLFRKGFFPAEGGNPVPRALPFGGRRTDPLGVEASGGKKHAERILYGHGPGPGGLSGIPERMGTVCSDSK